MKRKIFVICILAFLSGLCCEEAEIKIEVEAEPLLLLGSEALYLEGPVFYARPGLVITNKPRSYIRILIDGKVYRVYIEEEPSDD